MDAKVFGYYVQVCRCRSLARAAKGLGITPQGLSSAMRRLERELGVALFDLSKGGFELTPYGEVVLDYAERLDESQREMQASLSAMAAHQHNVIKLACSVGVLGYLGEELIDAYNERAGGTQILVTDELPDARCEAQLLSGECDLALIANFESDEFVRIPVVEDYQFFWVSVRNPLSRKAELRPRDLDGQTIVSMNDGYRNTDALLRLVEEAGARVRLRFTGEMMRVYEIARGGQALGLTCRNHIEATAESAKTVGVPFKSLPWGFSLCYRRDHALTEVEAHFVDYLRSQRRVYE